MTLLISSIVLVKNIPTVLCRGVGSGPDVQKTSRGLV